MKTGRPRCGASWACIALAKKGPLRPMMPAPGPWKTRCADIASPIAIARAVSAEILIPIGHAIGSRRSRQFFHVAVCGGAGARCWLKFYFVCNGGGIGCATLSVPDCHQSTTHRAAAQKQVSCNRSFVQTPI
jgi:hypothetical protein